MNLEFTSMMKLSRRSTVGNFFTRKKSTVWEFRLKKEDQFKGRIVFALEASMKSEKREKEERKSKNENTRLRR